MLGLQTNRGIMEEEMVPIDVTEPAAPLPVARLPPYNGFGSQVCPLTCVVWKQAQVQQRVFETADLPRERLWGPCSC